MCLFISLCFCSLTNYDFFTFLISQFCLQDTKSSNGTFVNNERLTRGSGENPEKEVRSGDIVQFGVDVVDTSKRVVGESIEEINSETSIF